MAKAEKNKTIEEVRANLEIQLATLDSTIEKATAKVDKLTSKRSNLSLLLEKVNRINVETEVAG